MIFSALSEAADKGELLLVDGGICRWHRRRDGIITIREILVLPSHRRKGVGKALFTRVLGLSYGKTIQAKCPVKYDSGNAFWKAMGFTLMVTKDDINLWQLPANP